MLVYHVQNSWEPPKKGAKSVVLTSEWRMIRDQKSNKVSPELYKITEDRGQKKNVATKYPGKVKELEKAYSDFWDEIGLNAKPLERPDLCKHAIVKLSSDITRNSRGIITQLGVRNGQRVKPLWIVNVTEAGRYRFEIRRWPREVTVPMTAGLAPASSPDIEYIGHKWWRIDVPGKALDIAKVTLELSNGVNLTENVAKDAEGVMFDVDLKPGPLDIQAWMIGSSGKRMGAYYVYAEKVL
jgi:hypothetical protein